MHRLPKVLSAFVLAGSILAFGLCGTASAQTTVGTMEGNGSYISPTSWSFNAAFAFDSALSAAMGDTGQFQFKASSAGVPIVDGNGNGGSLIPRAPAPWEILNTSAPNLNSTLYGPSFTMTPLGGGAFGGTLVTDGYIHWYYGYDGGVNPGPNGTIGSPGSSPLAAFGAPSTFAFAGTITTGTPADFKFTATVTAVPEPETYAMMLAGLGLMGFAARRRKHEAA